jgi:hypothetical protein
MALYAILLLLLRMGSILCIGIRGDMNHFKNKIQSN